jgi:hypothetical protein
MYIHTMIIYGVHPLCLVIYVIEFFRVVSSAFGYEEPFRNDLELKFMGTLRREANPSSPV